MDSVATLTGGLLVLLTWAFVAGLVVLVGLTPAAIIAAVNAAASSWDSMRVIRHSIWWGLLLITIWAYWLNIWLPLGSGQAAILTLLFIAVMAIVGISLALRYCSVNTSSPRGRVSWPWIFVSIAIVIAIMYFAFAALGPVTNYDTGLYHLGAIKYSTEYASIPGIANLYFPFGYSNAQFPLAALLSNGPWSANGFRLLNGLMVALVAIDLFLRLQRGTSAKRLGPGTYVLLIGFSIALLSLVTFADFWVTSPTQDAGVFLLIVVTTAYLVDTIHGRSGWLANAVMLGALAFLLLLFRQTSVFFVAGVLLVVFLLLIRRKQSLQGFRPLIVLLGVVGFLALGASTARDYVLSGWFQYPLSIFSFPVDWVAVDPTAAREATLGFHRNPNDLWNSISGFGWVDEWFVNRFTQWETYLFLLLAALTVILLLFTARTSGVRRRLRLGMIMSVIPSGLALLGWFLVTPPSYRFAWGPLFTVVAIPLGWLMWNLSRGRESSCAWLPKYFPAAVAIGLIGITAFAAMFRLDWQSMTERDEWTLGLTLSYNSSPIVSVPVESSTLPSGLEITSPVLTDQCWDNYPLCTPIPEQNLRLRFPDRDGFAGGFQR